LPKKQKTGQGLEDFDILISEKDKLRMERSKQKQVEEEKHYNEMFTQSEKNDAEYDHFVNVIEKALGHEERKESGSPLLNQSDGSNQVSSSDGFGRGEASMSGLSTGEDEGNDVDALETILEEAVKN
jgi:hypothetical protein